MVFKTPGNCNKVRIKLEWNGMQWGKEVNGNGKREKGRKKAKGEKKGEVDDIEMYLATLIYLVLTKVRAA